MDGTTPSPTAAETPTRDANGLVAALAAKDWAIVRAILADPVLSAPLLHGKTRNGSTPLMIAARGDCPADVAQMLIAQGAPTAAERKWVRKRTSNDGTMAAERGVYWTAADFAQSAGNNTLAEHLRALEIAAPPTYSRRKGSDQRCALCSERLRGRSKVDVLDDLVRKGEEANTLVRGLFTARPEVISRLRCVELHRVTDCKHFRKELSEVMAAVDALSGLAGVLDASWLVVDLCCGRSLAAALLSLSHGCGVLAVDRLGPEHLPHYEEAGLTGVTYLQHDLMAEGFLSALSAACAARRPQEQPRTTGADGEGGDWVR